MERKTIITNDRDALIKQLSKNETVFGVDVTSMNTFLNSLVEDSDSQKEFVKICVVINDHINKNNKYYQMLQFPAFVKEFYDLANDLIVYEIPLENLVKDDKYEIIEYVWQNCLIKKEIIKKFNELTDCSYITIYDDAVKNYQEYLLRQKLISKNAKLEKIKTKTKQYKIYNQSSAVNEIIALAQKIIKEDVDLENSAILVCDLNTYGPIIKRIFNSYHIPYQLSVRQIDQIQDCFVKYLTYLFQPNLNNFLLAYKANCFNNYDIALEEYISYLKLDYNQLFSDISIINNLEIDEQICSKKDLNKIQQLEKKAKKKIEQIKQLDLPFNKPLKEKVSFVYNCVSKIVDINNDQQYHSINNIKQLCEDIGNDVGENSQILLYMLNTLAISQNSGKVGIRVIDCYRYPLDVNNVYVVGCCDDVFVKNVNHKGLFNEYYLATIKDYPSLTLRQQIFDQQVDKIYSSIENITFSYGQTSLSGKHLNVSNYINKYIDLNNKQIESYPLDICDNRYFREENIKADTAKKLYLKDGQIEVSPTYFETFSKCHFQHFLKYGLHIDNQQILQIDSRVIGLIQHDIMHRLLENRKIDLGEITKYYFSSFKELFINETDNIEALRKRLVENLKLKVDFISQQISCNVLKVLALEQPVQFKEKYDDVDVTVKGTIDRVDGDDDYYMIVDYKSSDKNISESAILSGMSLQLLLYMKAYSKETNKKPLGAAYYSLKTANSDSLEEYNKENKLKLYHSEIDYEQDDQFFNNARLKLDSDKYFPILDQIIAQLVNNILSGDVTIQPHNSACQFCHYQKVCHNIKEDTPALPLIEKE